MNLLEEAKKVQNGHACPADIDLLAKVMDKLGETPTVVMLGAGEVMVMTVFGVRPKALLYSIDINGEPHNWEKVALENCGVKNANLVQIVGNSPEVAESYRGPKIDLLIVDADHSAEGVWDDLKAWERHLNKEHYHFIHDYDAKDAPYFYPGVKKACDKYFDRTKIYLNGWSAVWTSENKPIATKQTEKKGDKKGTKKTPRKVKK